MLNVVTISFGRDERLFLNGLSQRLPENLKVGQEAAAVEWVEQQVHDEALVPAGIKKLGELVASDCCAMRVTGVADLDVPATPQSYQPPERADVHRFDVPHLALAAQVGRVYGLKHVRGGRMLSDVFPKPGYEEKTDTAFGSSKEFDFHADGAVQPDTRPDFFALHCLRNDEQAPTCVSSISKDDLDPDTYQRLQEPVYKLYYSVGDEKTAVSGIPIIETSAGAVQLNYYGRKKVEYIGREGDAKRYRDTLNEFWEALQRNAERVVLERGEVLFVNNRQTLHGRQPFTPSENVSERRWLRRLSIATHPYLQNRIATSTQRVLTSKYA